MNASKKSIGTSWHFRRVRVKFRNRIGARSSSVYEGLFSSYQGEFFDMKANLLWGVSVVLVAGASFATGVFITGRGYEKFVIAPARNIQAGEAAIQVELLSFLRVGDVETAIRTMENILDNQTLILTQASSDPKDLPDNTVRTLKIIKTYRAYYPPQGPGKTRVERALTSIPEISDYKKECKAGICRLIEAKEAAPSASTTQPGI